MSTSVKLVTAKVLYEMFLRSRLIKNRVNQFLSDVTNNMNNACTYFQRCQHGRYIYMYEHSGHLFLLQQCTWSFIENLCQVLLLKSYLKSLLVECEIAKHLSCANFTEVAVNCQHVCEFTCEPHQTKNYQNLPKRGENYKEAYGKRTLHTRRKAEALTYLAR